MKETGDTPPGGTLGREKAGRPGPEEEQAGIRAKLFLTLFPFALVLLLLFLEWWFRGRS